MLWILIAIGIPVFGLALLIWGVRGRRIDDHPVCHGCRFDLVGHEPRPEKCPECGRDLAGERAIRIGNRMRRRVPMVLGSFVLLVMVTLGGALIWAGRTNFDWNTVKPTWLLVYETGSADAGSVTAALDELMSRYRSGALSRPRLNELITRGLAIQEDHSFEWNSSWGNFIEVARTSGDLSDEDWLKYASNALIIGIRARSPIAVGDPATYIMTFDSRATPISDIQYLIYPRIARLGAINIGFDSESSLPAGMNHLGSPLLPSLMPAKPRSTTEQLLPGTYDLKVTYIALVTDSQTTRSKPLFDGIVEVAAQVEILPAGRQTITLESDRSFGSEIREAFSPPKVLAIEGAAGRITLLAECRVSARKMRDIAIATDIVVRSGGREFVVGEFAFANGQTLTRGFQSSSDPEMRDFDADEVDVILRPNIEIAKRTIDVRRMWNEEIVLKDVPVRWQRQQRNES